MEMESKVVYQADASGFFLYETAAHELALSPGKFNVPYGAYEDAPPGVPEGMAAQRKQEGWSVVQDNRKVALYLVAEGQKYELGSTVNVDSESVTYDGGGPIPAWLTTEKPIVAVPPAQE